MNVGEVRLAARAVNHPAAPSSLPRFVAATVAGSALAAAGHAALVETLPIVVDGIDVLRVGVDELFTPGGLAARQPSTGPAPFVSEMSPAVTPVPAEPEVVSTAALVKGVDLARAAGERARAEKAAAAVSDTPGAAEQRAASGGGVQLVVGRVTSSFGPRQNRQHEGLDVAAPIGTPIRVPLGGTVIDSGPASGFGLWVRVRHSDGTITLYGHINRSLVEVGQRVSAGEVIAEVGNRGRSTGPHLHFEVITPRGRNINPSPWLAERGIDVT